MTMTSEQIAAMVADREAGTPGPWSVMQPPNWIVDRRGMDLAHIRGWGFLTGNGHDHGRMDSKLAGDQMDANARRIARAPDMEATIIAQAAEITRLTDLITSTEQQQRNWYADAKRAGDHAGAIHHAYATAVLLELMAKAGVK